jgi:hypothetical protein
VRGHRWRRGRHRAERDQQRRPIGRRQQWREKPRGELRRAKVQGARRSRRGHLARAAGGEDRRELGREL